ncbi:MAG: cyclic nucleotide-binding domain-containing protein [Pseudomonadota bacterium]
MSLSKEVEILSNTPLFRGVELAKLKLLAFMSEERVFHDGETIMRQGEEATAAFVLLDGKADVFVGTGSDEQRVASIGQNEMFGEMAILSDMPRSATVRASGDVRALRFDKSALLQLMRETPNMALEVMRSLANRLERTTRELGRARSDLALSRGRHG